MRIWNMVYKGIALIAFACLVWGCSNANDSAPVFDTAAGKHPVNWVERHWVQFLQNETQCRECHGSDLKGGVSRVSCFSESKGAQLCHATGPAGHPQDWPRPELHGAAAKNAPGVMSGYAACQLCHGAAFTGATSPVSCFSCHTNAPHPDAPWRGPTPENRTHTDTNPNNAPICAGCHLRSPGLTPGCFNNSLCHGASNHPDGWNDPAMHGAAAKDQPSSGRGLNTCRNAACHGADLRGGTSGVSCFLCHATAPHAPFPWRTTQTSTFTHINTNSGNAAVCGLCHTGGVNSPAADLTPPADVGCFNGTLCHGSGTTLAPHPIDGTYINPAAHGADAERDLIFCQGCHGQAGGAGSNPRFNVVLGTRLANGCETCHAASTAHPSTVSPDTQHWYGVVNHRNAQNQTNTCALCHGASLGGGAGRACTACHTAGSPLVRLYCSSCHGNPPPDPFEGNLTHREHDTIATNLTGKCGTCHNGAGAGTALHFNGTKNVSFDPAFNAQTGAASYNSSGRTCANVSCHGGQTTPVWLSGYINVSTECGSCHISGTTQYNSYNSGKHSLHVTSKGVLCVDCHDTAKLASPTAPSHFSGLSTPAFDLLPANTIRDVVYYVGGSCTPNGNFSRGCHGTKSW